MAVSQNNLTAPAHKSEIVQNPENTPTLIHFNHDEAQSIRNAVLSSAADASRDSGLAKLYRLLNLPVTDAEQNAYEGGAVASPFTVQPTDSELEAAVAEAGANPERAPELAEALGIGDSPKDEDLEPAAEPPTLRDSDPNGSPLRVGMNGRGETYAIRHPDGRLVADDFRKEEDGLTVYIDQAAMASSYGCAVRLRDVYKNTFPGEKLEIVAVQVGYKGRAYGVQPIEGAPAPEKWADVGRYTAAMARAAFAENDWASFDAFLSHAFAVGQSPLWPLLAAAYEQERAADLAEQRDPDDTETAEIRLYTRGIMAGIQMERMLHGARNKYGELVTDCPQRGEIDHGALKERDLRKAGAR